MALISTAKLLLLLCGLFFLLKPHPTDSQHFLRNSWLPKCVLLALLAFSCSLLWTSAPWSEALAALGKYGKLLVVLLLVFLIKNWPEALLAAKFMLSAMLFLLLSSWALFMGLPVPWATSNMALTEYAVFSSYLDQSIMFAVTAALFWHLRGLASSRLGQHAAAVACFLALVNVFFVLHGRTGQVIAIVLLTLAVMWELPKRYQILAVVLLPFAFLLAFSAGSQKFHDRFLKVPAEVQAFFADNASKTDPNYLTSSSGTRLHLWKRALESMRESPVLGSGVGSWLAEYDRLENRDQHVEPAIRMGNPHQEYLLWGVQLGLVGIGIFLAIFIAIVRDANKMPTAYRRALLSVLLALAVACLFNSTIYDGLIGDFFCICLGLLIALGWQAPKPNPTPTLAAT